MSNVLGGGSRGQSYLGTNANNPPNIKVETRYPDIYDTNYSEGDLWLHQYSLAGVKKFDIYMLVGFTASPITRSQTADWGLIGSGTGIFDSIRAQDAGIVLPIGGSIDIVGDGLNIFTDSTVPNTLKISFVGAPLGQSAMIFAGGAGTSVPVTPTGLITFANGTNTNTVAAGNTVTTNLNNSINLAGSVIAGTGVTATTGGLTATAGGLTVTAGGITATGAIKLNSLLSGLLLADGAGNIGISAPAAANGLVPISNGAGGFVWSAITQGPGSVTVTPGAGSITIGGGGGGGAGGGAVYFDTDDGNSALAKLAAFADPSIAIAGGTNLVTSSTNSGVGVDDIVVIDLKPGLTFPIATITGDGVIAMGVTGAPTDPINDRFIHSYGAGQPGVWAANTFVGRQAGNLLVTLTGTGNTACGSAGLNHITSGNFNSTSGAYAGYNLTTGSYNTLEGYQSGYSIVDAMACTAFGYQTLVSNVTAIEDTAVGFRAANRVTGAQNTAIGSYSMYLATTAQGNTFVGSSTNSNGVLIGQYNVGIGLSSCVAATSMSESVAVGMRSLYHATTAQRNCALGAYSMQEVVGASDNVAVGYQSLKNLAGNGYNNIAIGYQAGLNYNNNEIDNILIGNAGVVAEGGRIRIGTIGTHGMCFISGIAGQVVVNTLPVLINTLTGQLGTIVSSRKYKENISEMGSASKFIYKLKPVKFNYKMDETKQERFGLIAEDVFEVEPKLVVFDGEGKPDAVAYQDLPMLLLNEIQRLEKRIATLESKCRP